MRKSCAYCQFFVLQPVAAFPAAHGTCRRYAPRGPINADGTGWSAFPPVGVNNWCGEYEELKSISPAAQTRNADLRTWLDGKAK